MALQMNVSGIRRNIKNIAHNYTDAQVKVREATSNDPWGPSSTLMSEIADFSYNVVAFSEIMQMIWKRLNDHGRNWRHVYKALVLLEYLIKTGSEKVAEQCKENIFAIQTLKDFQYFEENKDQGLNVREKAKALVALLKDDERLRNERVRALKAKERFAQSVSGIGSDGDINSPTSPSYPDTFLPSDSNPSERDAYGGRETARSTAHDLEAARPQTAGEEELQLQLALAMSKEEAEQEEAHRKSDDVRLQMALSQSEQEAANCISYSTAQSSGGADLSAVSDLLDINFNGSNSSAHPSTGLTPPVDPWGMPAPPPIGKPAVYDHPKTDPWGMPNGKLESPKQGSHPVSVASPAQNITLAGDPWTSVPSKPSSAAAAAGNDPWTPAQPVVHPPPLTDNDPWVPKPTERDPFAPVSSSSDLDEFSSISARQAPLKEEDGDDLFDLNGLSGSLPAHGGSTTPPPQKSKSPAAFLGENSKLVNLENLVSVKPAVVGTGCGVIPGVNPFGAGMQPNPFHAQQAPKPSMNQMRTAGHLGASPSVSGYNQASSPSFGMSTSQQSENPFLL